MHYVLSTAKDVFLNQLLPKYDSSNDLCYYRLMVCFICIYRFPPVFDEWFLHSFPDPTAWYVYNHSYTYNIFCCYMYRYQARVAYIRTCAVMSIVGYILGLGDRHGENILFDSTNGDCVHVDFNCLFNRVIRTQ